MNYNRRLVNGRILVSCGASLLILLLAKSALADGAYQRTDDRKKTLVWNNDPQPGDAATWSGGRDSEGYAEGPGTLTWLRTQKQFSTGSNIAGTKKVPLSRYTGNMIHGKFEGAVVTIDHGKTYHATFADGQRKGRWSSGPIVAKAESAETEPAVEKRQEPASSTNVAAATQKTESAQADVREEEQAPAEGPPRENAKGGSQAPLIAQASEEPNESATPQKPVTKKSALAPGAVRAIDQPGRSAEKKSEKTRETPRKEKKAQPPEEPKAEPVRQEAESPAEGPGTPMIEVPVAAPSQPPSLAIPSTAKESPVDNSIRTLTGPPSSLQRKSPPAPSASPEISLPSAAVSPASSASPKLNAVQAMDIADIEARTKGVDLGEYQLPKAEYNAANDTWSVSYIGRDGEKSGKHLSVIVQDKTGKADVKK